MTHLWEVDHDYYGPDSNYFASVVNQRDYSHKHDSWASFVEDGGALYDFDYTSMNFLYRWDWQKWYLDKYWSEEEGTREELQLFFILPRKGILLDVSIQVTEDDEPEIRKWLEERAEYMRSMWEPLLNKES